MAWYAALLLPRFCRTELVGENGRSPVRMLVLMVLASAMLTAALPRTLLRSRSWMRLALGLLLPIVGALTYGGMVLATDLTVSLPDLLSNPSSNPAGPVSGFFGLVFGVSWMFLIGVPTIAAVFYVKAIVVAVPMGLVHVELARRFDAAGVGKG